MLAMCNIETNGTTLFELLDRGMLTVAPAVFGADPTVIWLIPVVVEVLKVFSGVKEAPATDGSPTGVEPTGPKVCIMPLACADREPTEVMIPVALGSGMTPVGVDPEPRPVCVAIGAPVSKLVGGKLIPSCWHSEINSMMQYVRY